MTRARLGLLCVCVLAGTGTARAQAAPQGWQVSADIMNVLTRGNDVHAGDVFHRTQTDGGTAANGTLDYAVTYEPIVTEMPSKISVLLAGGYRGARWGFGGRGWRVATDASVEGAESSATPSTTSSSVTGIRLWDHSDVPVGNDTEPSRFSPVTYHAENRLEHVRVDGYAERLLITGQGLNVSMRFGLAYARFENTRSEGMGQHAVQVTVSGATTTTFDNTITLEADSEAMMNLTGPSFGIAGDTTVGKLQIDWLVSPAVLFGTAESSADWIDTDNITQVVVSPGSRVQTTDRWRGRLPVSNEERAAVPVLDLQLKASVRLAGWLRVGGGLLSSSWFGVPMAPALSIPGEWTNVDGTGWKSPAHDLTFLAYSAFVAVDF